MNGYEFGQRLPAVKVPARKPDDLNSISKFHFGRRKLIATVVL